VGVLVDDAQTGKLEVKCHKRRRRTQSGYSGELKVPATIISHVVRDRRGILLAEASTPAPELVDSESGSEPARGSRMGAPLQAHGTSYGVVYVECESGEF